MNDWYLKTLKERDEKFLADLQAAEAKYKIEVERHARVLQDALDQARSDRNAGDLRLDAEKKSNRDNLEQQERRYNEEKERHRKVFKEAEDRFMKQLTELHVLIEQNEKKYLIEFNELKCACR